MKKALIAILLTVVVVYGWYWYKFIWHKHPVDSVPDQQALKVRLHSPAFNNAIDSLMLAYADMKDAFVKNDSVGAQAACKHLIELADRLKLEELKKDTTGIFEAVQVQVEEMKSNAKSLLTDKDMVSMRQHFRWVSENIYPLLKTIHYDGMPLYWQNCPMAFGEGKEANWISNSNIIENPYLGNKDTTMEHCGEIKDSIVAK